jgi:hypothetical protein
MTTYLGEKAVGIGTIKATSSVSDVLHDNTLTGNGNTKPLGINTEVVATKEELESKQDKLTAGENITIEDGVISAAGGGASGDYLPLSGGTLTGTLVLDAGIGDERVNVITFKNTRTTGVVDERNIQLRRGALYFDSCGISDLGSLYPTGNRTYNLGWASNRWAEIFVAQINNGAHIAVPTTGGTMALKEDIDAAVGDISTALTAILGE